MGFENFGYLRRVQFIILISRLKKKDMKSRDNNNPFWKMKLPTFLFLKWQMKLTKTFEVPPKSTGGYKLTSLFQKFDKLQFKSRL